jgi:hypothetical protein
LRPDILINVFPLLKAVLYHGVVDVIFVDRDRFDQNGRDLDLAVVDGAGRVQFFAFGEGDRGFDGGGGEF